MRALFEVCLKEINEFMQGYRVLCVTAHLESEKMWSKYADNHKGIALRIEPNLAKGSKFGFSAPSSTERSGPHSTMIRLSSSQACFGNQETKLRAMVEKIIYAKTLEWEYECEYRLAIAMRESEEPWNTDPYHPEEITELYLGLAMEKADRDGICSTARAVNRDIAIFAARRNPDGKLGFDCV